MDLAALEREVMKRKTVFVGAMGVYMNQKLKNQKYGLSVDYVDDDSIVGVRVSQLLLHWKLTIFVSSVKCQKCSFFLIYSSLQIILCI